MVKIASFQNSIIFGFHRVLVILHIFIPPPPHFLTEGPSCAFVEFVYVLAYFSFRGKSADFVMMFLFGAVNMIISAFFVNLLFLGQVEFKKRGRGLKLRNS